MIPRYTREKMGGIWSDENRFRTWLAVQIAAAEGMAALGMVPASAVKTIKAKATFLTFSTTRQNTDKSPYVSCVVIRLSSRPPCQRL